MTPLYWVIPALLAGLLSWLLTPLTIPLAVRWGALDLPGPRKLHLGSVPRIGGVAVVVAASISWGLLLLVPAFKGTLSSDVAQGMTLGLLPLFAVSLADDIRALPAATRLAVQCLSAIIAMAFGVRLYPDIHLFGATLHIGLLSLPLTLVWIVGVTNAFNLADGLDGLSAGLALISALSFSALGFVTGGPRLVALPLVLVGALLGFLPFNLYPARVFLGDCGAASIGFCLACLGVRSNAALSSGLAILVPVLVVGVPITDTALTIARRAVRRIVHSGPGIFAADRSHIHHRLIDTGINHPRAVLLLCAIAATMSAAAIGSLFITAQNAALLLVTLLAAAFVGIGRLRYDEFAVLRGGALLNVYKAPVLRLSIFPVFFDIGLVLVSIWFAMGLKYDAWRIGREGPLGLDLVVVLTASAVAGFSLRGLYRGSWKHVSVEDLIRSSTGVLLAVALGVLTSAVFLRSTVALSLLAIYGMILLLLVNATRSSFRVLLYLRQRDVMEGDAALIYGAGAGGALALRELLSNRSHRVRPIGFIDDDPRKQGRLLNGYPVLGTREKLERLLIEKHARALVIASTKISGEVITGVRGICHRHNVALLKFSAGLSVVPLPDVAASPLIELDATATS